MLTIKIDRTVLAVLALLFLGYSWATNSTTPTKPFTFSSGGVIRASEVNSCLDTLYTELQGNVGTANILDSAITSAKIVDGTITSSDLASTVTAKLEQTGVIKDYIGTTAPSGYVLASGLTLGDASSGATGRANADTSDLFVLIYTSMSNSEAAVSGGRTGAGTSAAEAAADYAAHKTIALPDLRGRVVAGDDNMGGTTASRITNAGAGIVGTTNGASGGTQTVTLTTTELPAHTHTIASTPHTHNFEFASIFAGGAVPVNVMQPIGSGGSNTASSAASPTLSTATDSRGSGSAFSKVQPTYILNKIIKL